MYWEEIYHEIAKAGANGTITNEQKHFLRNRVTNIERGTDPMEDRVYRAAKLVRQELNLPG